MSTPDKPNDQLTSAPDKEQQFIEKAKALINQTEATDVSQLLSEVISANLSQEAAKKLLEAIPKNYYEGGTIKDGVPQGIKDLINFLEPIAGPFPKYENMELDNNDGNESKSEGINDEEIGKLKSKVTSIVGEIQVINNNEKLGEISVILDNIGKILEKPNEANVKQLQTLIWNILAQGDNLDLGGNSYKKGAFCNGTLEESTLDGLKQVLDRVEKYVRDVREQMDVINRQSEVKSGLDVGSQTPAQSQDSENVTGSSESQQSKSELLGGYAILHQSITAFEASGLSLYSTEPSRKSVESDTQGSVDVVVGSTQNTAPEGDLHNKRVQEAVGKLNEMNDNNAKENIYLMPIGSETYAVRLDNQGCLYPIAVNVNSGKEILLKNNPSCIQYLKNKLSEKLSSSNDVKIMWNGEDYVIGKSNYRKWLTIEPMTIAGKWASKDLGQCLAFLNFTNYLRNEGSMHNVEFKNDNPDLRLGDGGNMEVRVKKKLFGKGRLGFSNTEFGLGNNPEDLKKFIKYNNGEHWEDDWDKKEENRLYGGIDISQEIQSNKRDQTQNENGGNNSTAQPSRIPDGGGSKPAVETQQNTPLTAVDNGFNRGNYGIDPSENVSVLKSGQQGKETYYYQYNEQIVRIAYPYYVAESASGVISAGNTLPQDLKFTPNLNVCAQGAEGLTAKLGELFKGIKGDNNVFGGKIIEEDGNYILQWPKEGDQKNNIMIGGKDFLSEHNIRTKAEGENCLKVLLYAYENYDKIQLGSPYTLPDDDLSDYGITDNNRKQVKERLDSLRSSSDK